MKTALRSPFAHGEDFDLCEDDDQGDVGDDTAADDYGTAALGDQDIDHDLSEAA